MSYLNPSASDSRRNRLIVGGLSVSVTALMAVGFLLESRWGYQAPEPRVIFIDSWAAGRTRDDVFEARAREKAALETRLVASRAYIASLPPGEARTAAQAQYDRYLAAPHYARDRDLSNGRRTPT